MEKISINDNTSNSALYELYKSSKGNKDSLKNLEEAIQGLSSSRLETLSESLEVKKSLSIRKFLGVSDSANFKAIIDGAKIEVQKIEEAREKKDIDDNFQNLVDDLNMMTHCMTVIDGLRNAKNIISKDTIIEIKDEIKKSGKEVNKETLKSKIREKLYPEDGKIDDHNYGIFQPYYKALEKFYRIGAICIEKNSAEIIEKKVKLVRDEKELYKKGAVQDLSTKLLGIKEKVDRARGYCAVFGNNELMIEILANAMEQSNELDENFFQSLVDRGKNHPLPQS